MPKRLNFSPNWKEIMSDCNIARIRPRFYNNSSQNFCSFRENNLKIETKLGVIQEEMENFLEKWDKGKVNKIALPNQQLQSAVRHINQVQIKWLALVISGGAAYLGINSGDFKNIGESAGLFYASFELSRHYFTSYVKEKEDKWKQFDQDAKGLFKNFQDLKRVSLEKESLILKNLQKKIYNSFLDKYDINNDDKISAYERRWAKKSFTCDLKDNWEKKEKELEVFVDEIENLREELKGSQQFEAQIQAVSKSSDRI